VAQKSWSTPFGCCRAKKVPRFIKVATTAVAYSNAPVGCHAAAIVKADGIERLLQGAAAVVTVGKQGWCGPEKF
jgi:hypothetical protein